MDERDKSKVGQFLAQIMLGTADLGFAALPLVGLYAKAKAERVRFSDMLMRDPAVVAELMGALTRQARTLPPSVLMALKQVIADAEKPG